ncbi:MAG TPA: hypothetical protein VIG46_08215 [Candidatus Baltobacteraceae bacterium]|jgi:hypothetical protein
MRGLLRYLVVASILVFVTVAAFATWWVGRPRRPLTIKSVPVTMAPRPGAPGGKTGLGRSGFLADAPWVLSTLPECLAQVSESTGPVAYVRAHVPADAAEVAPPATLVYGDCRISLTSDGAIVHRGPDTLRSPKPLRLFRRGSRLYALHLEGAHAQLRVYDPSNL